MPKKKRSALQDVRQPAVLCVDKEAELERRIKALFAGSPLRVVREGKLDRVPDLCEESWFDLVVLSSAAASGDQGECIEILEVLSVESPATQVLLLIRPDEIELAASALKAASCQYAKLPVSDEELRLLIDDILTRRPVKDPGPTLVKEHRAKGFEDMIGASTVMKAVYQLIRQAAATDIPVLLSGQTGTGKDLAAKAIHQLSKRSHKPYMPVHLGALPQDLVASELFGHEKGAFTGATALRKGSLELSHRGTVFLDEISTIDDRVQVSLLRLLETRSFNRIGGNRNIKANVRIIAASNEDLNELVQQGAFREDLYYRLEVFHITMPRLRDRGDDLLLLTHHFLKIFNNEYQKRIASLSPDCMACMQSYEWPGNIRELKNVIHRAVVVCSGDQILPEHLPHRLRQEAATDAKIVLPVGTSLQEAEREILKSTLKSTGNNFCQAAKLLGISRGTMYNKVKKYRIQ